MPACATRRTSCVSTVPRSSLTSVSSSPCCAASATASSGLWTASSCTGAALCADVTPLLSTLITPPDATTPPPPPPPPLVVRVLLPAVRREAAAAAADVAVAAVMGEAAVADVRWLSVCILSTAPIPTQLFTQSTAPALRSAPRLVPSRRRAASAAIASSALGSAGCRWPRATEPS